MKAIWLVLAVAACGGKPGYSQQFGAPCTGNHPYCTEDPTTPGTVHTFGEVCCDAPLSCSVVSDPPASGIGEADVRCTFSCEADGDCPVLPDDITCAGDRQSHCRNKVCQPFNCQ